MSTERFVGRLPRDLMYDARTDMWCRREDDGSVVVGATSFGLYLAGEIIAFMPKPRGAEVDAGGGLGVVETGKTVLSAHSPIAIRIEVGNDAAAENPALINDDPYGAGWMVRGVALDWESSARSLVDVDAYRAHCLHIDPDAIITD